MYDNGPTEQYYLQILTDEFDTYIGQEVFWPDGLLECYEISLWNRFFDGPILFSLIIFEAEIIFNVVFNLEFSLSSYACFCTVHWAYVYLFFSILQISALGTRTLAYVKLYFIWSIDMNLAYKRMFFGLA